MWAEINLLSWISQSCSEGRGYKRFFNNNQNRVMKNIGFLLLMVLSFFINNTFAQQKFKAKKQSSKVRTHKKPVTRFGTASYYAHKFHGRKTANGKTYKHETLTAACNVIPLNTWIKVTNLANNKTVIVKITDRQHSSNKRLVDLSRSAAEKLGFISHGLAKVKVEVLENFNPKNGSS